MTVRARALVVRASDPEALAGFWSELLGWPRSGLELAPVDAPLGLAFDGTDAPRTGLNQVHLHLSSNAAAQADTVARALALGASHLDVGQQPDEDHVVLADPDGNEFCVIEEGNRWLAGTGLLGELAAGGAREVGVFWSAALGWPLVHDEDEETAIAPSGGGFKISWGGPPIDERRGPNRLYLELVAEDLDAEVERLVSLGARVVAREASYVELVDPGGNELRLRPDVGSSRPGRAG